MGTPIVQQMRKSIVISIKRGKANFIALFSLKFQRGNYVNPQTTILDAKDKSNIGYALISNVHESYQRVRPELMTYFR